MKLFGSRVAFFSSPLCIRFDILLFRFVFTFVRNLRPKNSMNCGRLIALIDKEIQIERMYAPFFNRTGSSFFSFTSDLSHTISALLIHQLCWSFRSNYAQLLNCVAVNAAPNCKWMLLSLLSLLFDSASIQ